MALSATAWKPDSQIYGWGFSRRAVANSATASSKCPSRKRTSPSVQWLGSSLGPSSTDLRASASAASGSYSGKSGSNSKRAQPVWARKLRVELEDLVIELPGTVERCDPVLCPAQIRLIEIREGQELPCGQVIRVKIDSPLCELLRLAHVRGVEAKVGLGGLYQALPGFEVARAMSQAAGYRPAPQLHVERTGDLQAEVVLEREQVGQVAVVFLRQQMIVVHGIDQLGGHPDMVARFLHTAFQHITDAEIFRRRPWRHRLAAIDLGRVARDDEQPRVLC